MTIFYHIDEFCKEFEAILQSKTYQKIIKKL
jgi:hypothetical protein